MSDFSVANLTTTDSIYATCQSFTPNVPGPDGSGSPGTASTVTPINIIFGYPDSNITYRARAVYVYSAPLADPSDITNPTNFVVKSNGCFDGSDLGSGSNTRGFSFPNGTHLVPSTTYYVYFDYAQSLCNAGSDVYSGGTLYDTDGEDLEDDAQFKVNMST